MMLMILYYRNKLLPHVQACVECYTSDWTVVKYQSRHLSSSFGPKINIPKPLNPSPKQEFEVDLQATPSECNSEIGNDSHFSFL